MAAVSSKNATVMGPNGANPSDEGLWNYAVSPDTEKDNATIEQAPWQGQYGPVSQHNTNGVTRPAQKRSASTEPLRQVRSNQSADTSRLAPNKLKTISRKVSDISGANSSDADSLLDLYNQSTENLRTVPWTTPTPGVMRKDSATDKALADKWIHRDKLAQIESREMREAGLKLGMRSSSRMAGQASNATGGVVEEHEEEEMDNERILESSAFTSAQSHGDKRQRTMSPSRTAAEEDEENLGDLDGYQGLDAQRSQNKRSVNSRIPISRGATSGPNSPDLDAQDQRSRNNSVGILSHSRDTSNSHNYVDSSDTQAIHSSTQGRRTGAPAQSAANGQELGTTASSPPPKGKLATKKGGPTSRNAVTQKNAANQKAASGPSSPSSPTRQLSSQDGTSRPPTARPEGEPPWIATMFKPDPRLPPDQQMLPTHAKRLAQQQGYEFKEPTEDQSEYRLIEPGVPEDESKASPQAAQVTTISNNRVEPYTRAREPGQTQPRYDEKNQMSQTQQPKNTTQGSNQPIIQPQTFYHPSDRAAQTVESNQDHRGPEKGYDRQWPLKTPSPPATGTAIVGDGINLKKNAGTAQNGNKLTPTTQNPEEALKKYSPPAARTSDQEKRGSRIQRLPEAVEEEEEEEGKKKKGCGCCIVM